MIKRIFQRMKSLQAIRHHIHNSMNFIFIFIYIFILLFILMLIFICSFICIFIFILIRIPIFIMISIFILTFILLLNYIALTGSTDAARAAADIVLTEEGLSTIVEGIVISRCIFQRIQNFITYRSVQT